MSVEGWHPRYITGVRYFHGLSMRSKPDALDVDNCLGWIYDCPKYSMQVLAAKLFTIKLCYLSALTWHLYVLLLDGRTDVAIDDVQQVLAAIPKLQLIQRSVLNSPHQIHQTKANASVMLADVPLWRSHGCEMPQRHHVL